VALTCNAEGAEQVALWEEKEPGELTWMAFQRRVEFVVAPKEGERVIFARFRDAAENVSETVSCTVILDTKPPMPPSGLRAEPLSATEVRLNWSPATDKGSGVESYSILRDGIEIGKTRSLTYVDRQVRLGGGYSYAVTAMDKTKRVSEPCTQVMVAVQGQPPLTPTNPDPENSAVNQPTGVALHWRGGDPDRGDTVKYDLYFGSNPSPPLKASDLPAPSFMVSGLSPATTYHWRVVAKDLQGLESKGKVWAFTTAEKANTSPTAHVTAVPMTGKTTTPFRFDASGSKDAEDSLSGLRVRWDLDGDGKPETEWSDEKTITKTFSKIGTLTVRVFVKDSQEAEAKASVQIEIKNTPPQMEGDPLPQNGSTGEPVGVTLRWHFNDPDPGDKILYDVYLGKGEGKLRAIARRITESLIKPAEPLDRGTLYYWRVDARDAQGAVTKGPLWSFATAKKEVKYPLRAAVAVQPKVGKTTTPFRFDASGSADPEDPAESLRVRWDWNSDGKADTDWAAEKHAVKTFSSIGTVRVTLEVQNARGKTAKAFTNVKVENTPPSFVGSPTPKNGAAISDPAIYLGWKISDPDPEDTVTFDLYFRPVGMGELRKVKGAWSSNRYTPPKKLGPGTYNWKVVAKDKYGGKKESPIWTFTVQKRRNRPPFKPDPIVGPGKVRVTRKVVVKTRSRDPEKKPIRMRFDWGDGTVSPWEKTDVRGNLERSHQYARTGNYSIKAQAIDVEETRSPWSDPHAVSILPPVKSGEEEEDLWHWDPAARKKMPDLLTMKARYWFANLTGEGNWMGVGNPQADLDFRSDLGISERRGAPWVQMQIGKFITGGLEYFLLEYQGSSTFASDADFGGFTFPANTDVDTSCVVRYGSIFGTFNPHLGPYVGGGMILGLGYFWNRTTVKPTAGGDTEVETVETPVPKIGLWAYGKATKYFTVNFEFAYMQGSLQEFRIKSGRMLEVAADVTFTPVHWIGLSLGYRFTNVYVRIKEEDGDPDTELDLRLDGFSFSLVAHF
jgi:PKD repeat protein